MKKGGNDMKNTLEDLNNHLFEQLERLNDEELKGEDLEREIARSKSITAVAKTIIENGALALDAKKHADEYGRGEGIEIPLLGISSK